MIIDIHNHPYWYGYDEEKFLSNMNECGIDKTCLLSWETPEGEYDPKYYDDVPEGGAPDGPVSFRSCVKMRDYAPDRFYLGFAPDPRRPDAIDRLTDAKRRYGIKICGELKLRMVLDNPDAIRMYRVAGKENLPVLVHLEDPWEREVVYPRRDYWYGGGIDALERCLDRCPDTAFIGHAPGFWAYISADDAADGVVAPYSREKVKRGGVLPAMLSRYPNLYCDISAGSGRLAFARDPEYAAEFILKFQDRILFGRDCFDNEHRAVLESLGLPQSVLEKIYSENARRLLSLD